MVGRAQGGAGAVGGGLRIVVGLLRNHAARQQIATAREASFGIGGIGGKTRFIGAGLRNLIGAKARVAAGRGARFGDVFDTRTVFALAEFGACGGERRLRQCHRRCELVIIQGHQHLAGTDLLAFMGA